MALFAANHLMSPGFGKPGLRQLKNMLRHLIAMHNDLLACAVKRETQWPTRSFFKLIGRPSPS
jgi:hypothetical protein